MDPVLAGRRAPGAQCGVVSRIVLQIPVFIDFGDECHGLTAGAESPFERYVRERSRCENSCRELPARPEKLEIVIGPSSQLSLDWKRARQRVVRRTKQSSRVHAQSLASRLARMTRGAG